MRYCLKFLRSIKTDSYHLMIKENILEGDKEMKEVAHLLDLRMAAYLVVRSPKLAKQLDRQMHGYLKKDSDLQKLARQLNGLANIQRKGRRRNRVNDKNAENYFNDVVTGKHTKIDKKLFEF